MKHEQSDPLLCGECSGIGGTTIDACKVCGGSGKITVKQALAEMESRYEWLLKRKDEIIAAHEKKIKILETDLEILQGHVDDALESQWFVE